MFENLQNILNEIKSGNNLGEKITLVGATKMVDTDTINKAISFGLPIVAENKVQEFREKTNKIIGARQHFIGHLQTNKVKYLVGKVDVIQSVDTILLAQQISNYAIKKNIVQDILLEVNIGMEKSKSGFSPTDIKNVVEQVKNYSGINVVGLMAMLPHIDDKKYLANLCLQLRSIYDNLIEKGYLMKYLSLGMSEDYKIAIQNGSNMIRLGSAIFGKRNYKEK